VTADRLVTVSPGYAFEIQTPEGGWGLEGLLSSRSYALNGTRTWPSTVHEWTTLNYEKPTIRESIIKLKNKPAEYHL